MPSVKKRSRLSRLPLPRRPLEWGLAIVAIALVAIAITALGGGSSSSSAATKRTATSGQGVVQSTVSGNGTLEPAQKVELSFGAAGEVTAIRVKAGEKVTKGEVLAEVDSSSARASLASAEAKLVEAEDAVETAAEAEEEEEGEEVAYTGGATTELVDFSAEDASASAVEVVYPEAAGTTTDSTVGTEPSSGGGETSGGGTSEAGGEPTSAGATVSLPTAEANLREAELTVKSAKQEVSETTLRAPISGTIASISGAVGESVGENAGESSAAFMVIAQLRRLKMEVSFSESDIGKVRAGQTATVAIDSMEGTELAGEVTKVSVLPSESSSGVVEYPATILLTQSAKGLRAGMSASAEVIVESVKDAVTVPTEAITGAGSAKTVTVEEDGKEVTKAVKTGLEGDETTEVISGLKAGETLVLPEVSIATATEGSGSEGESTATPAAGAGFSFPGGGATGGPTGGGFPGGG
jgi:multidrug efflux pump subunit AcrA (membrane-fusion protein)